MKPKRLMTIPGLESRMPTAISELKSIARTKTTTRSAAQRPPLEVSTALTIRATTSIGCPTGPPLWFNNEANPHIRALSSFSFVLKATMTCLTRQACSLLISIYAKTPFFCIPKFNSHLHFIPLIRPFLYNHTYL